MSDTPFLFLIPRETGAERIVPEMRFLTESSDLNQDTDRICFLIYFALSLLNCKEAEFAQYQGVNKGSVSQLRSQSTLDCRADFFFCG